MRASALRKVDGVFERHPPSVPGCRASGRDIRSVLEDMIERTVLGVDAVVNGLLPELA
jgi:hypothetical protein